MNTGFQVCHILGMHPTLPYISLVIFVPYQILPEYKARLVRVNHPKPALDSEQHYRVIKHSRQ
jgi:hypothetical protein